MAACIAHDLIVPEHVPGKINLSYCGLQTQSTRCRIFMTQAAVAWLQLMQSGPTVRGVLAKYQLIATASRSIMPCMQVSQARLINARTLPCNAAGDAVQQAQPREASQPQSVALSTGAKRLMQGLSSHHSSGQLRAPWQTCHAMQRTGNLDSCMQEQAKDLAGTHSFAVMLKMM